MDPLTAEEEVTSADDFVEIGFRIGSHRRQGFSILGVSSFSLFFRLLGKEKGYELLRQELKLLKL